MSKFEADKSGDEITLKELVLKIREYFNEVIKYWWLVGLFSLFATSYFLYKHFTHVTKYNAELRFVVEGQNGTSGGLGSLLGSFGIKKGGNVNPYKIMEVGKSSKLFRKLIFDNYNLDSTLAEKIIEEYDLIDKWSKKNSAYVDFRFQNDDINSRIEKRVFKSLKSLAWTGLRNEEEPLMKFFLDEEKGVYSVKASTTDENLSIILTEVFYKNLKSFFEEAVFENQKIAADILAIKVDSLNKLRISKINQLARFEDRNKGLIYKENATRKAILTQEIQTLGIAYGELLKNYEMSDINLKNWQPFFMEIDAPFAPLYPTSSSVFMNLIYGVLVGAFLGFIAIVFRKIFRDIMNE